MSIDVPIQSNRIIKDLLRELENHNIQFENDIKTLHQTNSNSQTNEKGKYMNEL